jgi:hypothetical protein
MFIKEQKRELIKEAKMAASYRNMVRASEVFRKVSEAALLDSRCAKRNGRKQ